ncbi:MAG: class E sortase, partial [Acidimicrobiales bacterium]
MSAPPEESVTPAPAPEVEEARAAEPDAAEKEAPRAGPPRPGTLVVLLAFVLFASVVAAFLGVFAYGLSGVQEHRSQQQLYAQFRGLLAPASVVAPSIGGAIATGTPVALISAPAAGMHDVVVIEGTSSGDLLQGPGHLADTPLPGQGGEAVLVGKSTTAGAPFAHVSQLHRGDLITVRTGQGEFSFVVRGRIPPGLHQQEIPANQGRLVLVTSAGAGGEGGLEPSQTLDVEATLSGKAVAAPHHRPQTVAPSELPGQTDPAAWPFVALWLAGLALASAAVWWLWSRWGILRAWIVGAPVLLALLWG